MKWVVNKIVLKYIIDNFNKIVLKYIFRYFFCPFKFVYYELDTLNLVKLGNGGLVLGQQNRYEVYKISF